MSRSKNNIAGKAIDIPVISRIFSLTKPYRSVFYTGIALTLILAVLSPLRPWLVQYTIDHYLTAKDYDGLLKMSILLIGLLLVQTLFQYFHTFLTNKLGQTIIRDLRVRLFEHVAHLRLKFFDHTPIGTLITRSVSDLETIADIFSEGLIVIMGDLLTLFFIIGFMFYIDWRLTLISLSTIPFLMIATYFFKNGIKAAFREVRTEVASLNTFLQEHITGMNIVQIFNREEVEMEAFTAINKRHMNAHIKSVWYYSIFYPVVELLTATSVGLLVWWGAKGVMLQDVTIGNVIAFIMYINMLFRPIRELADKFNTFQMGMVSSERVFRLLDTDERISTEGKKNAAELKGEVTFKNVWFAYNEAADSSALPEYILKDLSFSMRAGQSVALVGATGAGKSSVVNLLGRMYEFQKGEITIDGISIRDYDLHGLRRVIAMVPQDVFLFSDTIHNNITLYDKSISREQVEEAARAVGAMRFIEKLPGGFDFNVMERGAVLSTGQRQLISFIRAYVFNPSILILDEATSSIDSETEELIRLATEKLTANRTSIIVAHRLSTIQKADKIILLDHGQKIEEGSHQELLSMNGAYKKLYEIQFSNI